MEQPFASMDETRLVPGGQKPPPQDNGHCRPVLPELTPPVPPDPVATPPVPPVGPALVLVESALVAPVAEPLTPVVLPLAEPVPVLPVAASPPLETEPDELPVAAFPVLDTEPDEVLVLLAVDPPVSDWVVLSPSCEVLPPHAETVSPTANRATVKQ